MFKMAILSYCLFVGVKKRGLKGVMGFSDLHIFFLPLDIEQ